MKYLFYILLIMLSPSAFGQTKTKIKALKEQALNNDVDEFKRLTALNQLASIYYNRDIKKAQKYNDDALRLAEKDSNSIGMCNVLINQSMLSYGAGKYDLATAQIIQAIKIAKKLNRPTLLATSYARLSLLYSTKGYAYRAIDYNIKAIKIAQKIGNQQSLAMGYYFIGKSYANIGDYAKAHKYFKRAITHIGNQEDKTLSAFVYMDIGRIHIENSRWQQAKDSINIGMELSKKMSIDRGLAYGNYILGDLHYRQKFNDQSETYFTNAQKLSTELEDKQGIALAIQGLARIALDRNQYKDAEAFLLEALAFAKESRAKSLSKTLYRDFSDVYTEMGEHKKAMSFYRKYHTVKDSIFNQDKNREVTEIQTKHNTEELTRKTAELTEKMKRQELEIDLRNERIKNQQLKNNQNSYIIIGLICGLLLLLIISFLVFRQDKLKNQIRETELEQRALRSQMNPHFMFNSLNSIQSLIATGNNAEASIYLAKFSRLMRRILQNSRETYIPLRQEIEFLENYIELEQRRFKEAFDCILDEDGIEDTHFVMIPPLVIQPFIENAIIHGLLRKSEKGTLFIKFEDYNNNLIKCTIKDNGIGRKAAAAFKTDTSQESLGIKITEQRLQYLTLKQKITEPFIKVIDLADEEGLAIGTQVELLLPIKYKA